MLCSRSVGIHLLRGTAALALLLAAMLLDNLPLPSRLAAFGGAIWLLRGCPACWLVGLLQTWQQEDGKSQGPGGQRCNEHFWRTGYQVPAPSPGLQLRLAWQDPSDAKESKNMQRLSAEVAG